MASCGQTGQLIRKKSLIITDSSQPNSLCSREIVEALPCTGDPCPCIKGVNCTCDLTDWSPWSECSLPCGGGQRHQTRQYKTKSTESCAKANLQATQSCNVHCCPIDGKFTPWSEWSTCSKECGSGVQRRNRTCTRPAPSCQGSDCEGSRDDIKVCNTKLCGE